MSTKKIKSLRVLSRISRSDYENVNEAEHHVEPVQTSIFVTIELIENMI